MIQGAAVLRGILNWAREAARHAVSCLIAMNLRVWKTLWRFATPERARFRAAKEFPVLALVAHQAALATMPTFVVVACACDFAPSLSSRDLQGSLSNMDTIDKNPRTTIPFCAPG